MAPSALCRLEVASQHLQQIRLPFAGIVGILGRAGLSSWAGMGQACEGEGCGSGGFYDWEFIPGGGPSSQTARITTSKIAHGELRTSNADGGAFPGKREKCPLPPGDPSGCLAAAGYNSGFFVLIVAKQFWIGLLLF